MQLIGKVDYLIRSGGRASQKFQGSYFIEKKQLGRMRWGELSEFYELTSTSRIGL
jgi:hypothetical protein